MPYSASDDGIESAMAALFAALLQKQVEITEENGILIKTPCRDEFLDQVSTLLLAAEKPDWSQRPRTYTVLRSIDRVDCMEEFVTAKLTDTHFPYNESRLPPILRDQDARDAFIKYQPLVLNKALEMKVDAGHHCHFDTNADVCFNVIRPLGGGTFGTVDHVQSRLSLKDFARKRVSRKRAFSRHWDAMRVFENELSIVRKVDHRHLVKYFGSYTDLQWVGLLMQPVADCDLKAFLDRSPFPNQEFSLLRTFVGCICSAVEYLHSKMLRHKDLKPGNVLIQADKVFLADFGTSKDFGDTGQATTEGPSVGYTKRYAAPEVLDEESRNASADIWSLGCLYLDIMTILHKRTLKLKDDFFVSNGTGSEIPCKNDTAVQLWLDLMDQERSDSQLTQWVRNMLQPAPKARYSAKRLLDEILDYKSEHVYHGVCCDSAHEFESNGNSGEHFTSERTAANQNYTPSVISWPWQWEGIGYSAARGFVDGGKSFVTASQKSLNFFEECLNGYAQNNAVLDNHRAPPSGPNGMVEEIEEVD